MLTFRGVKYAPVYCATGARGFVGEGYPIHRYLKHIGMDWSGTGFSGKTLTLKPRKGNMPLKDDGMTPQELAPRCIVVKPLSHGGEILNAVGLSNFGAEHYLRMGMYQRMRDPFFISVLLDADNPAEQADELHAVCTLIKKYRPYQAPMALQINFGCPNSGHDICSFHGVICWLVEIAQAELGIPVLVNCNALMPTEVLREAARVADGLWIGNTIPWKASGTSILIDWNELGKMSPIRQRGFNADGGLSSHRCLPFTIQKIRELRDSGVHTPIVAGNGIRTVADITALKEVGANGVFIGSLALVRPWRMSEIIARATDIFSNNLW